MRLSIHKEIEAIKEAQALHTIHQAAAFMRKNGQHDMATKWLEETLEPAVCIDIKAET